MDIRGQQLVFLCYLMIDYLAALIFPCRQISIYLQRFLHW